MPVLDEKYYCNQSSEFWQDGLPHPDYWMPGMWGTKIETPLDHLQIVRPDALIDAVKRCIRPNFPWPPGSDIHHTEYEEAKYIKLERASRGAIPALRFRELPTNKIELVRVFHSVLHRAANEPPIPDPDVMNGCVDGWYVASGLYAVVRKAIQIEREVRRDRGSEIDLEELTWTLEEQEIGRTVGYAITNRHFDGISSWLEKMEAVPREFWPFDPNRPRMEGLSRIGDMLHYGYRRRVRAVHSRTGWAERFMFKQRQPEG